MRLKAKFSLIITIVFVVSTILLLFLYQNITGRASFAPNQGTAPPSTVIIQTEQLEEPTAAVGTETVITNAGSFEPAESKIAGVRILVATESVALSPGGELVADSGGSAPINGEIVVGEPAQAGPVVSGRLAEWEIPVSVSDDTETRELSVVLPSARYVRVRSEFPNTEVSIITRTSESLIGTPSVETKEVKITNPAGDYELDFFTSTPYVSNQRSTSRGVSIDVENPYDIRFDKTEVAVSLDFQVSDENQLRIISSNGEQIYNPQGFDSNADGLIDFIRFDANMQPNTKESYNIETLEEKVVTTISANPVERVSIEDIPAECQEGLECGSFGECKIDYSGVFNKDVPSGVQTAVCSAQGTGCHPAYEVEQDCVLSIEQVSTGASSAGEEREVDVRDSDGKVVAFVKKLVSGGINIVFPN